MAMVAMVFASCKKEPTPAPVEVDPLDNGPVPVEFTVGQPNIEVKSTGTVGGITTAENVWNGETVFIYAFENKATQETPSLVYANPAVPDLTKTPLINGNANTVTSKANENVTTLNPKQEAGATIDGKSVAGEPYYYQNTRVYSFYGYHVDDAWNVTEGTSKDPATTKPVIDATNGVVIPIKINGGQDIMIAKADPSTDILARGANDGVANKYVPVERAYSAFSARRDVVPNLNFEHLLTRFTFKVVAGAKSAYNIQIESLTVASKNTADLVVVSADNEGRGLTNIGNSYVPLALQERTSNRTLKTLEPFEFNQENKDKFDPANRETSALGESLMVIPGETEYDLVLKTKLIRPENNGEAPNTPAEEYKTKIKYSAVTQPKGETAASDGKFEAGKSYEITLVVYGLEEVAITATLQSWKDGGSFEYDPDEDVQPTAQS